MPVSSLTGGQEVHIGGRRLQVNSAYIACELSVCLYSALGQCSSGCSALSGVTKDRKKITANDSSY